MEMICIRFFKTRKEAELGEKILKLGGISASVSEDKFNNVPIQKFGVQARFRLNIKEEDFDKATIFLAKKIKASRLT